jgi:crotonobetainyl-CoA:carnitine CoA-transferase CaiB-like acyl-CoA transferase
MDVIKGNHPSGMVTLSVTLHDESEFEAVSLTASKSGYTSLSMHFDTAEKRQEFIKQVTEAPVTTYG